MKGIKELKNKKILLVIIVCLSFLVLLCIPSIMFLKSDNKEVTQEEIIEKQTSTIFIGKILEIEDTKDNKRLLVQGYIKGCEIYEETLLALINEETEILSNCNNEKIKDFSVGDMVYIELSEAFTKSIPPQSVAKKIQVSKNK